jgi:Family of unknown function (DUF6348)
VVADPDPAGQSETAAAAELIWRTRLHTECLRNRRPRRIGRCSRGYTRCMFDAAVEIGLATFLAHPNAGDEELRAALEHAGVEHWLAERLVLYLPVALGRRLLAGATFSDMIADGTGERRIDEDPVYTAAAARAEGATREEMQAVAMRSAEVNAANQALDAGSQLEDLVFSPVNLAAPLTPPSPGHGGVPSPRAAFLDLLAGHGHAAAPPLAVDGRVFPRIQEGRVGVQVDFAVTHPELAVQRLLESFGGWATTWSDAINQTIMKFERSSLHPLIAVLLDRDACADQVSWEDCDHPSGDFDLCMGGQLVLYASEPVPALGPLVDSMKKALSQVDLSRAIHALRIYMCWDGPELLSREVLLDNEPWPAGEELAGAYDWPRGEGLWGSRLFMLLVPVTMPLAA